MNKNVSSFRTNMINVERYDSHNQNSLGSINILEYKQVLRPSV